MRLRRRRRNVVLYVTPGCHLCEDVAAGLRRLRVPFREVDASGDAARFLRVPVLEVDGREVAEGEIDPDRLRRAVR